MRALTRLPLPSRGSLGLVLVLLAACRGTDSAARPTSAAPDGAERLRADVAWLADDAREGRRAGTAGERDAARWIARRFQALGLQPAGQGGFLQPFDVPLPARDGGGSWLALGDRRSDAGADLVPLPFSAGGEATGPLVFRGYGIEAPERDWSDYAEGLPTGAVVLVVRGTPQATGGPDAPPVETGEAVESGGDLRARASLFHKVMTARRHGAAAVVVAPSPDGPEAPPAFEEGREARVPIPALAISAELAETLWPGYAAAARELGRIDHPRWTGRAGGPEGAIASLRADVVREEAVATNVLARLPGGDGPTVVVGAHFDHLGRGGAGSLAPEAAGEIHNGADDNASGTAVMLEVARRMAAAAPPRGDVVFAAWSGEELGLLGSEHWASEPTVALDRVALDVNLDMVGRAGAGTLQVLAAGSAEELAGWLAEAGAQGELELEVSLSSSGIGGSDHQTFLKRGIPAVHLFSGLHEDYHRPSDDVERFQAEGALRVADLAEWLVRRAQRGERLTFVAPSPEASAGRPAGRWSVWFGTVPEYAYDGEGLLLAGTSVGSPAEAAGLLAGDVLLQVGDIEITDIYAFVYALQVYKPGDVVRTRYRRDGRIEEVRVTLAARDRE